MHEDYKSRKINWNFDKFDSKTPLFSSGAFAEWHKRMLVAVQLKYYHSDVYNSKVRQFHCGDQLHLRMEELSREFGLDSVRWDQMLELPV